MPGKICDLEQFGYHALHARPFDRGPGRDVGDDQSERGTYRMKSAAVSVFRPVS